MVAPLGRGRGFWSNPAFSIIPERTTIYNENLPFFDSLFTLCRFWVVFFDDSFTIWAKCCAADAARIGPAGLPAPPTPRDTPHPCRAAHADFFFIGPSGVCLIAYLPGWLGGHLSHNISYYRCSFMTERTKGPAVSMRRPPTRGPQDPWTPREGWSAAGFLRPICAGPPLTGRRTACISMAFTSLLSYSVAVVFTFWEGH